MRLPLFFMITALAAVSLATGCGPKEHARNSNPAEALPPAQARVAQVQSGKLPIAEEVVGTVRAKLRATLEAKVSGRIQELPVRLGQTVKAGDLIARLGAAEIRARLDQAQAALQQTERDYQRLKTLFEQQAAARAEYDAAESRYSMAKGAVAEARAMMAYVGIQAPFDAVVTRKYTEVGDFAAPGKPLVDIEDPAALQLVADIPEALAGRITLDSRMTIRADGVPEEISGTVSEIAPAADPLSRTVQVKLDLPPGAKARPGQFARLSVPLGETEALRVPGTAVVKRGQMELAFVADANTARLRLIKTGRRTRTDVEIVSGLDAGERVVVEGASQLVDGQRLEVK